MKLLRRLTQAGAPIGWLHWCPGCEEPHAIWVEQPNERTGARWTFNGNPDVPDFSPSILVFVEVNGARRTLCHYFIHAGQIQFCGDSPHKLSGQTVPVPEFPPSYLEPATMPKKPRATAPQTQPSKSHRAVGKTVTFFPAFDTASPKRSIPGHVRSANARDGTVNLMAEDGVGTPHENVPLIGAADPHPASGPFAVDVDPTAAAAAPAKRKRPSKAKAKAPAKKKAKKS